MFGSDGLDETISAHVSVNNYMCIFLETSTLINSQDNLSQTWLQANMIWATP